MGFFGLIGLQEPTAVQIKFLLLLTSLAANHKKTVTFKEIFARNIRNIPIYGIHATVPSLPYYTTFWEACIKWSTSIKQSVGSFPRMTA